MVSGLLIVALLVAAVPAWGGGGQARQFCVSCHPVHYAERGRCVGCHLGNPASERKNIAHAGVREGKYARFTIGDRVQMKESQRLLDLLACRRCHVSAGIGNSLAVNLDRSAGRKTAGEVALSIKHPVANMPDFGLDEGRITALVNVILSGAQGRETTETAPVRVHFNESGEKKVDLFSKKCGSCHRMLSERLGAVGTGVIGPNLSGLLSKYYPGTFKNNEPWTAAKLASWLKNPRQIRLWARMQPVALTAAELKELESVISVLPKPGS